MTKRNIEYRIEFVVTSNDPSFKPEPFQNQAEAERFLADLKWSADQDRRFAELANREGSSMMTHSDERELKWLRDDQALADARARRRSAAE